MRRLGLAVGEEAEAPAAYLAFPGMKLERLEQSYRRTALDGYDYRAPGYEYSGMLTTGDHGLIIDYPGLWRAVGE